MAALPQPNKHPPASQIETLTVSSNRTTLRETRKLIGNRSLPSNAVFVEISSAVIQITIVTKIQQFCNR